MKEKRSVILYGLSFIIAILGEAYLLNVGDPHIFSIVGIGIVVILTGYLWLESIWEYRASNNNKFRYLWEISKEEEAKKEDARYREIINLQKATYTAIKKSQLKMQEEMTELSKKMDQLILLQKEILNSNEKEKDE